MYNNYTPLKEVGGETPGQVFHSKCKVNDLL